MGGGSLLECFYEKTSSDRERWAKLFDHVGRSLKNSGAHLDKTLIDRVIDFFEWRFQFAEPLELKEFTYWLEAECLDPNWRLQSYSKILDFVHGEEIKITLQMRSLSRLLPDHVDLVVECFAKITDSLNPNTKIYFLVSEAKPILEAGLNAKNSQIREYAERAKENLLRLGHFEFLDVV